jgi:hypothetical protein
VPQQQEEEEEEEEEESQRQQHVPDVVAVLAVAPGVRVAAPILAAEVPADRDEPADDVQRLVVHDGAVVLARGPDALARADLVRAVALGRPVAVGVLGGEVG